MSSTVARGVSRTGEKWVSQSGYAEYAMEASFVLGEGYRVTHMSLYVTGLMQAYGTYTNHDVSIQVRLKSASGSFVTVHRDTSKAWPPNGASSSTVGFDFDIATTSIGQTLAEEGIYEIRIVCNDGTGFYAETGSGNASFTYDEYYTDPTVTSIAVANSKVLVGNSTTLSWTAQKGTGNSLTGRYNIYRNGSYWQQVSGTSLTIAAESTPGAWTTYQVVAIGNKSNSALSSAVGVRSCGWCTAPTAVSVVNSMPDPGATTVLSWSGAGSGSYNAIAGYQIFYGTDPDGEMVVYTTVSTSDASGSVAVEAPASAGEAYYYRVATVGELGDIAMSSAYARVGANRVPDAPALTGSGVCHGSRPRILITVGTDTAGELQTLACSGYTLSRSTAAAGEKIVARRTSAMSSGSETVTVSQTDPYGGASSASTSVTYTPVTYEEITAGRTAVKAAHMTQLRDLLDDICDFYGLEETDWSEEIIAGRTPSFGWASHVLEIQQTISRIVTYINGWDTESNINNITLPTMLAPDVPSADVMAQLRDMILLI